MRLIASMRSLCFALMMLVLSAASFAKSAFPLHSPASAASVRATVCAGDGYLWIPGYWAYADDDYYWVPGTWVMPPQAGLLWTPGYWGWGDNGYVFNDGYWVRP